MTDTVHKFEAAGLGIAPYKLTAFKVVIFQACPGAPVQVGGSCDYCGTGIKDHFFLLSTDGRSFKVGSSCITKSGDKGLIKRAQDASRATKRKRAAQSAKERVAALRTYLSTEDGKRAAKAVPTPLGWAEDTLFDWALWMLANSGQAGKLRAIRTINKKLGLKL